MVAVRNRSTTGQRCHWLGLFFAQEHLLSSGCPESARTWFSMTGGRHMAPQVLQLPQARQEHGLAVCWGSGCLGPRPASGAPSSPATLLELAGPAAEVLPASGLPDSGCGERSAQRGVRFLDAGSAHLTHLGPSRPHCCIHHHELAVITPIHGHLLG